MKKIKPIISVLTACVMLFFALLPAAAIDDPETPRTDSALIYCLDSGQILYEKNADKQKYPTALTKLMTALLVSEYAKKLEDGYNTVCTVSPTAFHNTTGQDMELLIGEELSIHYLLVGMLLQGANDAANVLAEEVSGTIDKFVVLMNQKAKELGMNDTWYTNPTGLHDISMVTTAYDQLKLVQHAMADSEIAEIAAKKTDIIPKTNKHEAYAIGTRNFLVSERTTEKYYLKYATGLINGETPEGGFCVVGAANRNGLTFVAIMMDCETITYIDQKEVYAVDENGDALFDEEGNMIILIPRVTHTVYYGFEEARDALIWAYTGFEFINAIDRTVSVCEIPVKLAKNTDKTTLIAEKSIEIFVPTDINREEDIVYEYELDSDTLYAPIKSGQKAGTVKVYYRGDYLGEVDLIVNNTIEQNTILVILNAILEIMKTPLMRTVLFITVIGIVTYIILTAIERNKKKKKERKKYLRSKNINYLE